MGGAVPIFCASQQNAIEIFFAGGSMMASGKCVIFQGYQIPFPPPSGTTHDRLHILYMLCGCIHRGSHTSAHVLLNLLIEFGKRYKIRGLPSILSLFRNEFNKLKKNEHEC